MLARRFLVPALVLALAAVAEAKDLTPQQQKMGECNTEAGQKNLTGQARKDFMKQCLSGEGHKMTQQEKMKVCNKQASAEHLNGEARQTFMSHCLSN